MPVTEGTESFSVQENFRKILKVSHFYLGFSLNKNNNEIKQSQRVSLDFLDPDLDETFKDISLKTLMKLYENF